MIQRLSFALVNDGARYTHFIRRDGLMDACADLKEIEEAFVVIFADEAPATEAQLSSVPASRDCDDIEPRRAVVLCAGHLYLSMLAGIKALLGVDPKKDYKDKVAEVKL